MIASLECVDFVVVSDNVFYSSKILKLIRPDVLVKVKRFDNDQVKYLNQISKIIERFPELKFFHLEESKEISTTKLIEKISNLKLHDVKPNEEDILLINEAKKVAENGYSYSGFKVGVSILSDQDTIFTGCNISNSSPSLAICAERAAIVRGVSKGMNYINKLVLYSPGENLITPCGLCRQSIYEFNSPAQNTQVLLVNDTDLVQAINIRDLLPFPFHSIRK